jgi:hypothetical protein
MPIVISSKKNIFWILFLVAVPDVPEVAPVGGGGEGGGEQAATEEATTSKTEKPAKAR